MAGESAWSSQARADEPGDFALALERHGETAVLVLAGELDLYRAPAIKDALAEAIGPKRHLAVDLRLVTFMDSTTLTLLLAASRRQGGRLSILVGPQTPMTAFEATGFDRLLAISRLDDEPRNGSVCTVSSERIGLRPPPQTTLKGRNHNGNIGSN